MKVKTELRQIGNVKCQKQKKIIHSPKIILHVKGTTDKSIEYADNTVLGPYSIQPRKSAPYFLKSKRTFHSKIKGYIKFLAVTVCLTLSVFPIFDKGVKEFRQDATETWPQNKFQGYPNSSKHIYKTKWIIREAIEIDKRQQNQNQHNKITKQHT